MRKFFPKRFSLFIATLITLIEILLIFYFVQITENVYEMKFDLGGILFIYDDLGIIFSITSCFIAFLIFLYSFGYFKEEKERDYFSFWGLIFLGSMLGVIFSDNLISLYFFWEIAGLCSYRLIGFYREKEHLLKADKAFMITVAGAGIMFLSFAYIYSITGTFSLSEMKGISVSPFVFLLFFIGVITKSATFPFHTWLPDASVAPTPVTAFLHAAVLVKIGIYGLLRIFWKTLTVEGNIVWALYLCIFSSLIAGIVALIENDFKKILAYSTVSQLGFLITGILTFNNTGISGSLIFYIAHALGKGGLFLTAGLMEKVFKTKDITKMGGVMKNMPFLTFGYLFSMFSVIGIPPFAGFFGKINIIMGVLKNHLLFAGFFLIISSILTLLYLWRTFKYVFIFENATSNFDFNYKGSKIMTFSILTLGLFSFLIGIMLFFVKGGIFGY
ncbi:MAG TPA: proton-conducting transporter membrane subunit [bacterium]|nr:proton-conducting transporter membrane subunit [bacterium]